MLLDAAFIDHFFSMTGDGFDSIAPLTVPSVRQGIVGGVAMWCHLNRVRDWGCVRRAVVVRGGVLALRVVAWPLCFVGCLCCFVIVGTAELDYY